MRKKIVAGNWKMNLDNHQAVELFRSLNKNQEIKDVEIIIAPASIYLSLFSQENLVIKLAGQNVSSHQNGAFTGEVSSSMLSSLGVGYCIVGHSERRAYQNESNQLVFEKTTALIKNGIRPIFCCGELLQERKLNKAYEVVSTQLSLVLNQFTKEEMLNMVIAYEPVWAFGTGLTASAQDAQQMHQHIRSLIEDKFGSNVSEEISILYGGSCKPENASELFSQKDIDGGLIGGASLDAESFIKITKAF
jgi:triosephosphate isomerase